MRVLKECNVESFYYRSLPIASVAMFATHFAVKSGYLKPNLKYGSILKVLGAGFIGYFAGKFSYQRQCAEKIMRLPNSNLAEVLRRRKGMVCKDSVQPEAGFGFGSNDPVTVPQTQRKSSLDLDLDQNTAYQGLDDSQRPTLDTPERPFLEEAAPPQASTSYEDLRRKNRDEFAAKQFGSNYRRPPAPSADVQQPPSDQPPSGEYSERPRVQPRARGAPGVKNKYGDVWEDS
jgi:hypothetical protein